MARIGQIKILEDKAEELSILAQYIKDPELMNRLAMDTKRLNALSEEEEKKAAEARALIVEHKMVLESLKKENDKHEANKAEIAAREAALQQEKNSFSESAEKANIDHKNKEEALIKRIAEFEERIRKEDERQSNAQKGFNSQIEKFGNEKKEFAIYKDRVAKQEQEALALKAKYEKKIALIKADYDATNGELP